MMKTTIAALLLMCSLSPAESTEPNVVELKRSYLDSLCGILVQHVEDDDLASAKVVAAEIQKVRDLELSDAEVAPCGFWLWHNGTWTVLYPGGVALNGGAKGAWSWTSQLDRTLRITWNNEYIDEITLSANARELHCTNNRGEKFVATRIWVPSVEAVAGGLASGGESVPAGDGDARTEPEGLCH